MWTWEHPDWPDFQYDNSRLQSAILAFYRAAERLAGQVDALSRNDRAETLVDLMVSEAIRTSAIEGETLDRDSVRSSIAAFAGFAPAHTASSDPKAAGIAEVTVDVRTRWNQPLTDHMLCHWQSLTVQDRHLAPILRGQYRQGDSPMQIVSGFIGRSTVHYEAPPSDRIPKLMTDFLRWYNDTQPQNDTEPIPGPVRAGIAHLWFEQIHPFDDGNGRVGRAIADHALSQSLGFPTLACLSTAIDDQRKDYYAALISMNKDNPRIDSWLDFFIRAINNAQDIAKGKVDFVLGKARFHDQYGDQLNDRQAKVIARVFATGIKGFTGGLSTRNYETIARCSNRTAIRDLAALRSLGAIGAQGQGRSTRYRILIPEPMQSIIQNQPYGVDRDL